jgi:hypothetical protein
MYITIPGENLWSVYTKDKAPDGIYRGGGNASSPRAVKKDDEGKDRVRPDDFDIKFDESTKKDAVYPNPTLGLSFASSVAWLRRRKITGTVWRLPRNARLPPGLVVNYNDIEHPLINVAYKMSVPELVEKLRQLEALLEKTGIVITK